MDASVYVGFDFREAAAFAVTNHSLKRQLTQPIPVRGLVLDDLRAVGLYTRPVEWRNSGRNGGLIMWDTISDAPMSTEFAVSRFLVPLLAETGWALFCDCDMLFRSNVIRMFDKLDSKFAVYCVKHNYQPKNAIKMDGQQQTRYNKKLWSSFCVFNCGHPSNQKLTAEMINSMPGRDLHAFCWLEDDEIGELPHEWNWIPNHSPDPPEPKCVHFTEGGPWFHNYRFLPYAEEWVSELKAWAGGDLSGVR